MAFLTHRGLRKDFVDARACLSFTLAPAMPVSFRRRLALLDRLYAIDSTIRCMHTQAEAIAFIKAILSLAESVPGVIVECGCFKGGSTAKFSLAADIVGRNLVVFDSFQGLPPSEQEKTDPRFPAHRFNGALDEVKTNVAREGNIDRCRFIPGWFADTLPHFTEPIAALYIDVDLVESTRTVIKHLYPLLSKGGVICSQDGHVKPIVALFADEAFWQDEVGCLPPAMEGIGTRKLIKGVKH